MAQPFQQFVFELYEQRRLRNWFYTLAFAIFVPTGFRFAMLAWEFGDWFDKPLSIIAGLSIGITSLVTLLRVWAVPPVQTSRIPETPATRQVSTPSMLAVDEAVRRQAAANREAARGARALGASHGWPFHP
jgi:hypothetical protein